VDGVKRTLWCLIVALGWLSVATTGARSDEAVTFLESIKGQPDPYLAPSEIDPGFTTAVYVNVATKGPSRQRMWFLHRDDIGGEWRLGMWDKRHWKRKAKRAKDKGLTPSYSWPISSGRYYRGDRKSGPTPPGIYGLDERRWRYGRGWLQYGMRHVMHIDYHYRGGRVSGVAFHGTNRSRYRRLGRADSHGCIRMRQELALAFINRITGKDGVLSERLRWGEVPRYFRSEKGRRRYGYKRDGSVLLNGAHKDQQIASLDWPEVRDTDARPARLLKPQVLPKQGFRTIVIFFKH